MEELGEKTGEAPQVDLFVGEYCSETGEPPEEAEAAAFEAARRNYLEVVWRNGHARIEPAGVAQ